jgi:hypothetical protein
MVGVSLTAPKTLYQVGEPIEVAVKLENTGLTDVQVAIGYPSFRAFGQAGLIFTPVASLRDSERLRNTFVGSLETITSVRSRESITVLVYLERFLQGLVVRHYEIPWFLEIPCIGIDRAKNALVSGRGILTFDIAQGSEGYLTSVFESYIQRLQTGNAFHQREAAEALQLAQSPLVIPYLQRLPAFGYTQQAFEGLIKFAGEERAREFVLGSLRSGKARDIVESLNVLSAWGEQIPVSEARLLLTNSDHTVQLETLRYLGRTPSSIYLPLLEEFSNSSDLGIAAAAREAKSALTRVPR